MPKRISLYLNDQDQAVLGKLCKSGKCTPSEILRSGIHRLNDEPTAPARADPVTEEPAKVYPGEIVFHESQIDKEERLKKEAREKLLAKARADADAFIASSPDLMTKWSREASMKEKLKHLMEAK